MNTIRLNRWSLAKIPDNYVIGEIYCLFSIRGDRLRYTTSLNISKNDAIKEMEMTKLHRTDLVWFAKIPDAGKFNIKLYRR